MAQTVIKKEKIVDLYQPILPYIYPYANLVGDINGGGNGFTWDGNPKSKIKWITINPGNDMPMNLQTLNTNIEQTWSMAETEEEITQRRAYRNILDRVYETEEEILSSNILSNYLKNVRPKEMTRYVSAKLYDIAKNSGHSELFVETASLTKDNIVENFDNIVLAMEDANTGIMTMNKTLYLSQRSYAALKNSPLNERIVMNNDGNIGRNIETIDGIKIVRFSQSELKTKVNTNGAGYLPTGDAKNIHAILVIDDAVAHPYGIDEIRVDEPSALSDNKSVFGSWYCFDVFQHPEYNKWGVAVIAEPEAGAASLNP